MLYSQVAIAYELNPSLTVYYSSGYYIGDEDKDVIPLNYRCRLL